MLAIPVYFRFRGGRNYVQGSDLWEACVHEVGARHPLRADGAMRLAAHQIITRQCTLLLAEPDAEVSRPEEAYADFSAQTGDGLVRAYLMPTGDPVHERFAYDEERIEAACQLDDDRIMLASDTGYSPIEVAIAMNKRLHNARFPLAGERWIFTRIDLYRPFRPADAQQMTITFLQKLGVKLTRSAIAAGGQSIGHIFFSAVPK